MSSARGADPYAESEDQAALRQLAREVGALDRFGLYKARRLVTRVAPKLGPKRTPSPLGIEHVLDTAIITAPEKRDPELFARLDAVAGRVLKRS